MNQNSHHCFLLDGKTIFPINQNSQSFISLKKRNKIENKYCSCYQKKYRSYLLNHHCRNSLNEKLNLSSCSLQLSEDKYRKFSIEKHHKSDQQINNNETYLITRILPSLNFARDSIQINNNQSPSAITIIIKPFISSENHRKNPSLDRKSFLKKRKNSSSSLKNTIKRISNCLSDQTINKHRLSTFKDITRLIPTKINPSTNILNSRTLLDIYRNKKQYKIKK